MSTVDQAGEAGSKPRVAEISECLGKYKLLLRHILQVYFHADMNPTA